MKHVVVTIALMVFVCNQAYSQWGDERRIWNKWMETEWENPSCPMTGRYSSGKTEEQRIMFFELPTECYIEYMGEKTWLKMSGAGGAKIENIWAGGYADVVMMAFIAPSGENNGIPSAFTDERMQITFHLKDCRTQAISVNGKLYTASGKVKVNQKYWKEK